MLGRLGAFQFSVLATLGTNKIKCNKFDISNCSLDTNTSRLAAIQLADLELVAGGEEARVVGKDLPERTGWCGEHGKNLTPRSACQAVSQSASQPGSSHTLLGVVAF